MQAVAFFGVPEVVLRFGAFASVFIAMALVEIVWPKRDLTAPKGRRWLTNLSIVALDVLLVRLMAQIAAPLAAVAAALYAETQGIGLLNWLAWPSWVEIFVAIVALDLAVWFQHWAAHRFPVLWRLHQVHHADVDIDVTTAIRFHPIEIGLSMLWKVGCVLVLGISPVAVVLFEIILNACAMFNHANIALPGWLDRALRLAIVTPDMHRIHHSVSGREHNSNYGFNLSIWDRLFGTYTAEPAKGHRGMTIGLPEYQSENPTRVGWSLALPFRRLPPRAD